MSLGYDAIYKIFPGVPLVDQIKNDVASGFLLHVANNYKSHYDNANNSSTFYLILLYSLSLLIPIFSALLTWLSTTDDNKRLKVCLGALLTVLTIASGVLKPYESYMLSSNTLVKLREWQTNSIVRLTELNYTSDDKSKLYTLLQKMDDEIQEIGETVLEKMPITPPDINATVSK